MFAHLSFMGIQFLGRLFRRQGPLHDDRLEDRSQLGNIMAMNSGDDEGQRDAMTFHDLAFSNEAGNFMNNKKMLRRYFRPLLKTAGCPAVRFHDLRHTYASLLIEQGENIK